MACALQRDARRRLLGAKDVPKPVAAQVRRKICIQHVCAVTAAACLCHIPDRMPAYAGSQGGHCCKADAGGNQPPAKFIVRCSFSFRLRR